MKIWAKVRFRDHDNSEYLIRRFFEEANNESSLSVRGRVALIEYVDDAKSFRGAPQELIKAISKCEVLEFKFGREMDDFTVPAEFEGGLFGNLLELSKCDSEAETFSADDGKCEEQDKSEETAEVTMQTSAFEEEHVDDEEDERGEKVSEVTGAAIDEELSGEEDDGQEAPDAIAAFHEDDSAKAKKTRKQAKRTNKKVEACEMDELKALAEKSQSFTDFINKVIVFVGIEKKQQFFQEVVLNAAKLEVVSWENIEEALKAKDIVVTSWDKVFCSNRVKAKFQDDPRKITILKLVNSILLYKEFEFTQISDDTHTEQATQLDSDVATNTADVGETTEPTVEVAVDADNESSPANDEEVCPIDEIPEVLDNASFRIQCFPRNEAFEQGLRQMSEEKSVEEQLKYLLDLMGVNREDDTTKQTIFEFTHQMVTCPQNEFDFVFKNIAISGGVTVKRMVCADFINQFAKRCGATELVSLESFYRELRDFFSSATSSQTSSEE